MSYWSSTGKHEETLSQLHELINQKIIEGGLEVMKHKQNKSLNKLRRAKNVYYDIYNNGLCNLSKEFKPVFGSVLSHNAYKEGMYWRFSDTAKNNIESKMDELIIAAAKEQGITTDDQKKKFQDVARKLTEVAAETGASYEQVIDYLKGELL